MASSSSIPASAAEEGCPGAAQVSDSMSTHTSFSAVSGPAGGGHLEPVVEPDLGKMEDTIRDAIFSCSNPEVLKLPWELPGFDMILGIRRLT